MISVVVASIVTAAAAVVAFVIGHSSRKPAVPAPVAEPKIFGLEGFENLVGAIPATADASAKKMAVDANTSLIVGFLGYKDEVAQQAQKVIDERHLAIRQNNEKIAGLQEEIVEIEAIIDATQQKSAVDLSRIEQVVELKRLKTS